MNFEEKYRSDGKKKNLFLGFNLTLVCFGREQ